MSEMTIAKEAPPDLPNTHERVELMRDRFESIRKNYAGMLYFCSRILCIPEDEVTMLALKQFETIRFLEWQEAVKNCSFPVSWYLSKNRELESANAQLRSDIDKARAEVIDLQHEIARRDNGIADMVPTTWLDPLLTGDKAVIGKPPYGCPDIERLLNAIRKRIFYPDQTP